MWSQNQPAEETNSTLARAVGNNQYWRGVLTLAEPLDLRNAEVRFTVRRLGYHAPRRYAVFTGVAGFVPGAEVFDTGHFTDLTDREFVFRLPDSAAYAQVAGGLELRLVGWAGQYSGHLTSLRAFRMARKPDPRRRLRAGECGGIANGGRMSRSDAVPASRGKETACCRGCKFRRVGYSARVDKQFAVAGHWSKEFDERAIQDWAEALRARLGLPVSLGLVFVSPRLFRHAPALLEILRVHARIPLLVGCSSQGLIAGGEEIEENAGFALGLYSLPGAKLDAFHFTQRKSRKRAGPDYGEPTGMSGADQRWLAFLDPYPGQRGVAASWNEAYAPLPVLGGLASADQPEPQCQVYLNGASMRKGAWRFRWAARSVWPE